MSLRSPLGKVRGLGSANEGVEHWWMQRVSAVALIPLMLWFVFSLASCVSGDYESVRAWVATPLVSVMLILMLGAMFYHTALGLQVVLEDYIHSEGLKVISIMAVKLASWALAAICIFSVLKVSLGS